MIQVVDVFPDSRDLASPPHRAYAASGSVFRARTAVPHAPPEGVAWSR
jgi:hypothetical protein